MAIFSFPFVIRNYDCFTWNIVFLVLSFHVEHGWVGVWVVWDDFGVCCLFSPTSCCEGWCFTWNMAGCCRRRKAGCNVSRETFGGCGRWEWFHV